MSTKLKDLIEEVYGIPIGAFPSTDFRDMGIYIEAFGKGYNKRNWLNFRPRRTRQGFSLGDDLHLKLLVMCEKVFNITIKDEEAEDIKTIEELKRYVEQKTKGS